VPVLHRASRARLLLVLSAVTFGCGDRRTGGTAEDVCPASPPDRLEAEVVAELAHDPTAFTQGLVFDDDGSLYESTGLEGSSTVREVDPVSGEVMQRWTTSCSGRASPWTPMGSWCSSRGRRAER
jgi:glutamine cyclotransferase